MLSHVRRTLLVSSLVGATGTAVYVQNDPRLRRQAHFWSLSAPIVGHYVYTNLINWYEPAPVRLEAFNVLHERYASQVLDIVLQLRGLYVKFGQVCSVRPEFVPDAYRAQFRKLQSDVPPTNFDVVRQVVEEELQQPLEDVFEEFSESPVGAASIGQAHVARVKGSREKVVVKVQYPDASALFDADMRSIGFIVRLVDKEAETVFSDFQKQLKTELDFEGELRNIRRVYDVVMPKYAGRVQIPKPKPELCTKRMITMSYLPGEKLDAVIAEQLSNLGIAVDKGFDLDAVLGNDIVKEKMTQPKPLVPTVGTEEKDDATKQPSTGMGTKRVSDGDAKLGSGGNAVPSDSAPGDSDSASGDSDSASGDSNDNPDASSARQHDLQLQHQSSKLAKYMTACLGPSTLLTMWRWFTALTTHAISLTTMAVHVVAKTGVLASYPSAIKWIEDLDQRQQRRRLVQSVTRQLHLLLEVHGYEVFHGGIFNADPHPGNIILMADHGDQIGLIDYGQCKQVSVDFRRQFARTVIAVADGESDEVVAQCGRDMGIRSEKDNTEALATYGRLLFSFLKREHVDPEWNMELYMKDHIVELPQELVMLTRMAILLRGLSLTLGFNVSVSEAWRPFAQEFLDAHPEEEGAIIGV